MLGDLTRGVIEKAQSVSSNSINSEDKFIRKNLISLNKKDKLVTKILSENSSLLSELAESGNKQAEDLLAMLSDEKQNKLLEKLNKGQALSGKDTKQLIERMRNIGSSVEDLGLDLSIGFDSLLDHTRTLLDSSDFTPEERRKMLGDLLNLVDKNNSEARGIVDSIEEMSKQGLNFTKDQTLELNAKLDMLAEKTKGDKIVSTLRELNKNTESLVRNSDELEDFLSKKSSVGTVADKLKSGLGGDLKEGLLSILFQNLGLGGLDKILGLDKLDLSDVLVGGGFLVTIKKSLSGLFGKSGKIAKFFTKVMSGGKTVLKGLSKFPKIFKTGLKIFGKVIAPIMAIFDFVSGWANASEITGIKEEDLTTFNKVMSGISSIISGLTFGLIEPETIFKAITSIIDWFSGLATKIGEMNIVENSKEFLNKIGDFVLGLVDSVLNFFKTVPAEVYNAIKENVFDKIVEAVSSIGDTLGEFFSKENFLSMIIDTLKTLPLGETLVKSFGLESKLKEATEASKKREELSRTASRTTINSNILKDSNRKNSSGGGGIMIREDTQGAFKKLPNFRGD